MMHWYDGPWSWGAWMGAGLMMLVWVALIGLAVWAVARATRTGPAGGAPRETPRQILDRRLAAGEIDAEQYAQARHLIDDRPVRRSTPL